jgi:alpha-D-xyloside xylohydrolase
MARTARRILPFLVPALLAVSAATAAPPERTGDGIIVPLDEGPLKIEVCAPNVVRVAFAPDPRFFERRSLAAGVRRCEAPSFDLQTHGHEATLATGELKVRVDLKKGRVSFFTPDDHPILAETEDGRELAAATVQGEATHHVRQAWQPIPEESLYGLGQNQLGLLDLKGYDLDLWQHNIRVVVPFMASSQGYGILWDNTSYTRFGDLRPFEPIPKEQLFDAAGEKGGLSGSYYAGHIFERHVALRIDPKIDIHVPSGTKDPNLLIHPDLPPQGEVSVRWEGSVMSEKGGTHLLRAFSNGGIKLWFDDELVIDHWRQGWLPWYDMVRVEMDPGRHHRIRLEWTKTQDPGVVRLEWKTPSPTRPVTSLWSEVGDGVDYYFVYGPAMDRVVAGYRRLTGEAPMMPRWAFGLFQSRQRYETARQVTDVLEGFRSRGIPLDTIVQDWFYWKEDAWGSHEFDPARFPDPEAWIRKIHDQYKARFMISVWPKFYPGTANFEALQKGGYLYESTLRAGFKDWVGPGYPYAFYDAFNEQGRDLYWKQLIPLFSKGIDAWWLDATEPDLTPSPSLDNQRKYMNPTAMGTGARMLNAYSLVQSEGIYRHQRELAPNQRVFILTRSAFAGQQRDAAATWSGDVTSTWTALRKQIAAGLDFALAGIPYWTHDIGGFAVPPRFSRPDPRPEDVEEWRELNARWFQFGTFTPLTRVHGEFPHREMWNFGGETSPAYKAELEFDRLRYRMLPYVYSLVGEVTREAGTIMRPLVMDFPADARAHVIADQYMFGPAFLVSPVTTYKARSRLTYLPLGAGWYDFWTGEFFPGGQAIDAPAPFDRMPLYMRTGSIVPFGPELQRTDEKPADPITLFVYAGADGAFTLYEDDGLTYDYEKGAFARIPLRWDDAKDTLTIAKREGSFPGMLAERTFQVVLVSKDRRVGFSFEPRPGRTVRYAGDAVEIDLGPAAKAGK